MGKDFSDFETEWLSGAGFAELADELNSAQRRIASPAVLRRLPKDEITALNTYIANIGVEITIRILERYHLWAETGGQASE